MKVLVRGLKQHKTGKAIQLDILVFYSKYVFKSILKYVQGRNTEIKKDELDLSCTSSVTIPK